jgi:hypothetical protein
MRLTAIYITGAAASMLAAQTDVGTRGIVPEEVWKARPQPKAGAPTPKPQYQPIGPAVTASLRQPSAARQVGVTIWRLRSAAPGDTGARILVQQDANTAEWIPERVSSSSALKAGDRVRLSIESPEAGYLYVIDRERYATGERGEPVLIFPTSRTRDGDNRVTGGKLIDIPAQDDRPSFFSLQQSRADQTEEELTVLLTSEPIGGLKIGAKALRLSNEQVAQWEKQWDTSKVERFELSGGAGKTWTRAEQQAGADATRLLTQEDPPPQTVYRVSAQPGEPLMVKVRLRYTPGHSK